MYVVLPATVTPDQTDDTSFAAALELAALDMPLPFDLSRAGQIIQLDIGRPPDDLVVTLHRLVI